MTTHDDRPQRAANVTLSGEMPGSAYATPQWLIQRGDRYLQVSEVLYRIAELADGTHTPEEMAILVAAMTRKDVSADDVRALVSQKLAPAGVIAAASPQQPTGATAPVAATGSAAPPPSASPLQVQLKAKLIGPRIIDPLARLGSLLYLPGFVLVALAATIGTRVWIYTRHGLGDAVTQVIYQPWWLGVLTLLAVASAAFHELGHASALRAGGGRARGMGVGLYFIWPAFYTDVTESYRLGRWRRIVTDLGGFYFNLVFSLFVMGAYVVTRNEALLVGVALVDFEILHQTLPLGRLDGYWLLADITGVPDFFSIALPFFRRLARRKGAMPSLRPVASVVVFLYLVLILPALALLAYLVAQNLPGMAVAALDSFLRQGATLDAAIAARDLGGGASAIGQGMLLVLPLVAVGFFILTVFRLFARLFLAIAGRTRRQRIAGAVSAVAAAALLFALWTPFGIGDAFESAASAATLPHSFDIEPPELPTQLPQISIPRVSVPVPARPNAPASLPPLPVVPSLTSPRTLAPAPATAAPATAAPATSAAATTTAPTTTNAPSTTTAPSTTAAPRPSATP